MPVGSMPYLTRSGLPVCTLRWSFFCSSSSGTTCSAPRRIRASCSSTDFTSQPPGADATRLAGLGMELKAAHSLESVWVMRDRRLTGVFRPGDRQHVEASGLAEQAVFLQEAHGQVGQTALLGEIHRGGGFFFCAGFGGANFDEDDATAVEGDQIQLALRAAPVALDDAVAESSQVALGG